MKSQA